MLGFWGAKGGVGTTVVTAATALAAARRGGARLVDLPGDVPAVLGHASDPEQGVADWLAARPDVSPEALDRVTVHAAPGLALVPRGRAAGLDGAGVDGLRADAGVADESGRSGGSAAARDLAAALSRPAAVTTIVDLGRADTPVAAGLAAECRHLFLVVRPCYVALRRAVSHPLLARTDGLVVVTEPRRALTVQHVGDVLPPPLVATVPVVPSIARAVDAGILASRPPDELRRATELVLQRHTRVETAEAPA